MSNIDCNPFLFKSLSGESQVQPQTKWCDNGSPIISATNSQFLSSTSKVIMTKFNETLEVHFVVR